MSGESGVNCPNCGRVGRGRFCTACGTALHEAAQPAPSGSLPPASGVGERPLQRTPGVHATAHFRVYYGPGSFAEQNLLLIASRLENACNVMADMLEVDLHGAIIDVHLSELVVEYQGLRLGGGGYAVPRRMQIHDVYVIDSPGESLERSLLVVLLTLAVGNDREAPPLIVDGLHTEAMQRLGALWASPTDGDQLTAQLMEARARGELPSILTLLFGPTRETQDVYFLAARGFVTFLIRSYGLNRLKQFVVQLDPKQPDASAQAVYGRTLAQLEKAWNKTIRLGKPGGVFHFIKLSGLYLREEKLKVAELIVYTCLGVAFTIGLAKALQLLFDRALPHPANPGRASAGVVAGDPKALAAILIGVTVAFVLVSLAQLRQTYLTGYLAECIVREMRLKMFALLQHLQPEFFQPARTDEIMSRMKGDMTAIQSALTGSLAQGLSMVLMLAAAALAILITDLRLAAVGLLCLPLLFVSTRYVGPPVVGARMERQRQLAASTGDVQETLSAQPVIRAFGLEDRMVRNYSSALDQLFRASVRLVFLTGLAGLSARWIATAISLAVVGLGAALVIGGHLTQGVLVAFLALMAQVIGPLLGLPGTLQELQQASVAMERVDEMLQLEPPAKSPPDARSLGPLSREIRLENVTFGYGAGQNQLDQLSLIIPAGASVALVGPSGCGKSTVLNLIMRFYDPDKGRVILDGVDIREATLESVRCQTGVVFQENTLFKISIRENVRLGNLEATDEEVETACQAAEVHDLIMSLPEEYDTVVGERGSRLSGGQRQRIAIARAILRNPAILLLDEATSALDSRTEAAIAQTLARLGRGRTTIRATHRLANVVNADLIYVLDRGVLVEQGTHDDLLERGGLYTLLWQEQGGAMAGGVKQVGVEVSRLQSIPMFTQLDPNLLAALARRLMIERFAAGDEIVRQGDLGDKLYIVQRGQVEVVADDPSSGASGGSLGPPWPGRRALAALREGDYFGEMALLNDKPRAATVRARTAVQLYSLSKGDFTGLLNATPQLRDRLEQVMVQRMAALGAESSPTSG